MRSNKLQIDGCPSSGLLASFAVGNIVDSATLDAISFHVESCSQCVDALACMDPKLDPLIELLQRSVKTSKSNHPKVYDNEEAIDVALRRVLEIRPASVDTAERDTADQAEPTLNELPGQEPNTAGDDHPRFIGTYRLVKQIGSGGMGIVYEAIHTKMNRAVALKVLPTSQWTDERVTRRFEREMQAVGQLNHPNIVVGFDAGKADGHCFLVMELLEGVDLSTLAKLLGQPIALADACELIRQAAVGIGFAHQNGIVHRDVKPSNIMLGSISGSQVDDFPAVSSLESQPRQRFRPPIVKLLDLGLARFEQPDPTRESMTSINQIMGTIDYMSPEQCLDSRDVDSRSDIYSLGATLYSLLTGRAPWSGVEHETQGQKLQALLTKQVPSVAHVRADLPDPLVAIVDRCLKRDPHDRFQTADELVEALIPFAENHNLSKLLQRAMRLRDQVQAESDLSQTSRPINALLDTDDRKTVTACQNSFKSSPMVGQPQGVQRQDAAHKLSAGSAGARRTGSVGTFWTRVAIAAAGGALLWWFSIILLLPTKNGVLRIEINDPSLKVFIIGGSHLKVRGQQGEFEIEPGEHALTISVGGSTFQTNEFTVGKGAKVDLRVTLLRGDTIRVLNGQTVLNEYKLARELIADSTTPRRAKPPDAQKAPVPPVEQQPAFPPVDGQWQPTDQQQAFFDAVEQLSNENRRGAVSRKIHEISFSETDPRFNDALTEARVHSEAFNQVWPLLAIPTLRTIDLIDSSVTDLRPLTRMPIEHLRLNLAAYNPRADAVVASMEALQTVNGKPKAVYLTERAAIRQEIDDFAKVAGGLTTQDVIAWINPRLKDLNPGCNIGLVDRMVTAHNLIGYTKEVYGYRLDARFCFGLRDLSPLRVLPFHRLETSGVSVCDLSPLEGLPIKEVMFSRQPLADLSPLRTMALNKVWLEMNLVRDLEPLRGMPLQSFVSMFCPVNDLSPLQGAPLTELYLENAPVTDLSPLIGMQLTKLDCIGTPVSDLSPLAGMPLISLDVRKSTVFYSYGVYHWGPIPQGITDLEVIRGLPLENLGVDYSPAINTLLREMTTLKTINGEPVEEFLFDPR